mmetsp:Transcript_45991/g.118689  ORF Transcript_45991/g.118689 Transcript_45991/m.118689 type:complete len:116 (+) Transcript_45991:259-606(+)
MSWKNQGCYIQPWKTSCAKRSSLRWAPISPCVIGAVNAMQMRQWSHSTVAVIVVLALAVFKKNWSKSTAKLFQGMDSFRLMRANRKLLASAVGILQSFSPFKKTPDIAALPPHLN